jgi:hypothetical protein
MHFPAQKAAMLANDCIIEQLQHLCWSQLEASRPEKFTYLPEFNASVLESFAVRHLGVDRPRALEAVLDPAALKPMQDLCFSPYWYWLVIGKAAFSNRRLPLSVDAISRAVTCLRWRFKDDIEPFEADSIAELCANPEAFLRLSQGGFLLLREGEIIKNPLFFPN